MGTKRLLAGNLAVLVIATLAFSGLLPWFIAGYIIVASVIIASITYFNSVVSETNASQEPKASRIVAAFRERGGEDTQQRKITKRSHSSKPSASPAVPETLATKTGSFKAQAVPSEPQQEGNDPEQPARIGEDDYLSFDLDLEEGEQAIAEVSSSVDVNVYVLTDENVDALDLGQEFWYEAGAEGVRNATLRFKAPDDGKWFLVVENAGSKEAFATIKVGVNKAPHSTPSLKTESLGLPDAKLEGKL